MGALSLVLAALLCVSRRETVRLEKLLVTRDASLRTTTAALAAERVARRHLEADPRTLLRRVIADRQASR